MSSRILVSSSSLLMMMLLMVARVDCEKTVLACNEFVGENFVNEDQIQSDKCTFSYVEIDEPNDIQIAPLIVKDVDYESNVNEIDVSEMIISVHFVNSRLSRLPNEIFLKFTGMKNLNCDGVNLQSLTLDDIDAAKNLEDFSCNSNYVKSLSANLFRNCVKLKNLDLSINDIESIDSTTFSALKELKKLLLYDNQLNSIPHDVFMELINLEEINLSNNQIQIIAEELFSGCKHLKYIYLNDNQLENINDASLSEIENIAFLEISNNHLKSLTLNISASALYANNNQLESINLRSIGYLSFYNNSISNITFHNTNDVLSLNVSTNSLNASSMSDIKLLSAIKSLDLSFNDLGKLNVTTFLELNELQILNLQSTRLTTIDYGLFVHQTKLEQLDISYNNLGTFDFNKLNSLKALNTLFIEGNNITEFNYEKIKLNLPNLKTIGYTDNSWKCSFLISLNAFLEANGIEIYHLVSVKSRPNVGGIACITDDEMKGMSYEDKSLSATNSIRHELVTSDNESSAISKKFEALIHHINKTNHDYVSKNDLINEMSMMKTNIASLERNLESIVKKVEKLPLQVNASINEAAKYTHNASDMSVMKEKLSSIERILENLKNENINRMEQRQSNDNDDDDDIYRTANARDDFITKAMISIIFVIVCGFALLYIIKLYAWRHKCRDLRSYTNGDNIDENIL